MERRRLDWAAPGPSELAWRRSSGAQAEEQEFYEGAHEIALDAELDAHRAPEPRSLVLRVVSRETYTFDITSGPVLFVPITDVISCVGYRRCVLQLRVHETDAKPGTCDVGVGLLAAARDPRAPSELLLGTSYLVSTGFDAGMDAPALVVGGLAVSSMPDAFIVMMEIVSSVPGAVRFTLGVDVVLRK